MSVQPTIIITSPDFDYNPTPSHIIEVIQFLQKERYIYSLENNLILPMMPAKKEDWPYIIFPYQYFSQLDTSRSKGYFENEHDIINHSSYYELDKNTFQYIKKMGTGHYCTSLDELFRYIASFPDFNTNSTINTICLPATPRWKSLFLWNRKCIKPSIYTYFKFQYINIEIEPSTSDGHKDDEIEPHEYMDDYTDVLCNIGISTGRIGSISQTGFVDGCFVDYLKDIVMDPEMKQLVANLSRILETEMTVVYNLG